MNRFLELPAVRSILPVSRALPLPNSPLRADVFGYFMGRFPISVADGLCGDRYVVVGDAAGLMRPFKGKGVNSAWISGVAAARAMVKEGIPKSVAIGGLVLNCGL